MYPVLIRLGPLTIYSYGTMMAVAFLTAAYLTGRELERRGYSAELASRLVVWAAVGGLVGARAWSVANDIESFLQRPFHTLFGGAGFVWYGGLAGGLVAVSWAIRRHGLPWRQTVDCIAPALSLAHGIGRIGCELAGDGDWGKPSTLPWAHSYPRAIIGWENWTAAAGYPPDVRVHPTPLYEAAAYTAVFAILWSLRKRDLPPGSLFWLYLTLAPAARFAIEFLRLNPPVLWGLTQAQLFSVLLIAVGAGQLAAARWNRAALSGAPRRGKKP
jgi:phosphatidylglycerol:prolipoprotein diacylglycerol transferase